MHRTLKPLATFAAVLALSACGRSEPHSAQEPEPAQVHFSWFEYRGNDEMFAEPLPSGYYQNPIIAGFYPDPSIVWVDDDYYMVHSSFAWYPGVPIFRSNDLVNWEKLGHVLTTPQQLQLEGRQVSEGIFAPTIRYHEGLFYMITTGVHAGGNFFVTATDPSGPWSDPVFLPEVGGIDPDIFFDDDGRIYITHNDAPEGEPLYEGHRALWLWEFDQEAQQVIPPGRVIVDGGVDISQEPIWIEAPHIFKHNDWYYLTAAEGGTGPGHSQVIFRSRSLEEPFEAFAGNPILTQRDLPSDRENPITSAGHADLIQTPEGEWWAVFLATRTYEEHYHNTGRETFLLPVRWEDEWPIILDPETPIPYRHPAPKGVEPQDDIPPTTGNFTWRDDFDGDELSPLWSKLRISDQIWHELGEGRITLYPQATTLSERSQPAFLARRQAHMTYSAGTELRLPLVPGISAGLVAFQNETHHFYVGVRRSGGGYTVFLEVAGGGKPQEVASREVPEAEAISLSVEGDQGDIGFYYQLPGREREALAEALDGRVLSTFVASGFVGAHLGIYTRYEP